MGSSHVRYSADIADAVVQKLAEGQSLRTICEGEGMPNRSSVIRWAMDDVDGFAAKYARARELQAETLADEMADIADDGSNDWMEVRGKEGEVTGWKLNGEAVARSKLRLEQRRWYAEKLLPKKYGAKIDHNHSGKVTLVATPEDQAL